MRRPRAGSEVSFRVRLVRAVLRTCLLVGLAAQAASVVVISYGVHLRTLSDRFGAYEKSVLAEMDAKSQGRDSAPGTAVGMILASTWWFVGCIMLFPLFIVIFALFLLRVITQWNRTIALLGSGALAVPCCLVAFAQSRSALEALDWGFATLGGGELLHGIGLVLSAIGAPYVALRTRASYHRPSRSAEV